MAICHNGQETCPCGADPSPLCPGCQQDAELGAWWRREGSALMDEQKRTISDSGSKIAMALACNTVEEMRLVLDVGVVEQRPTGETVV